MSIQSEITRISGNVSDALSAIADKGVTVPSGSNSDDLADLIDLIPQGNANVTQDANGYVVLDDDTPSGSTQSSSSNEIEFNPMQSGSGDPSPSNVRSIIPGLTFTRDDSSILMAYGGVLNTSTGVLTVDRTIIVYNSSSGFTLHSSGRWYKGGGLPTGFDYSQRASAISNMALYGDKNQTYAAWFAAGSQGIYINRLVSTETEEEFDSRLQTTPFQLCYYLATPATYQLTANEITRAVSAINSYTLVIGGVSYEGVTGIQATDANDNTETYIRPEGSLSIAANGTYDVTNSASAVVNVSPSLQAKTNISPSTSSQTITADTGYYGLSSVQINAMASGSVATPATTITANPAISVSSGGLITATASASSSVTPTVSAGYVSSGTAGTVTVSGSNTSQLTVQAAQTIHPSTSDQTIASGKYLTGTQTIKAVTIENLTAANIKKDVVIKIGDSTDDDCVASITGTYEGGGGSGSIIYKDLDGYLHLSEETANVISIVDTLDTAGGTIRTITGATGGGGSNIYYSQYTLTGDTTIATFIPAIAYEVHSTSCIIMLRSNGTVAPSTGSYTMNNILTLFQNGERKSAAEHYVTGQKAPNSTTANVLYTKEENTLISMTNGVLTTTSTSTSCIGAAGDVVTLVEIDVDDDFYDILKAVKTV